MSLINSFPATFTRFLPSWVKYNDGGFLKKYMNGFGTYILYVFYDYGEMKHMSISFFYGHGIIDNLKFIYEILIGERESEDYIIKSSGVQIAQKIGVLHEHGFYPRTTPVYTFKYNDYNIWKIEDMEPSLNEVKDYLMTTWLPYVEKLDTIEKLEYEVNEGSHFQLQLKPIPENPNLKLYLHLEYKMKGLILAKMVSEEQYRMRREFYIAQQIKEDEMGDYEPDNTKWLNFIEFMDNNSKENLLNLVEEYDEKYLKNKKNKKAGKTKEQIEEEITPIEEKEENVITITGFDSDGEPEIRKEEDGSLTIAFNFMPPLNGQEDASDDLVFENFDKVMSEFLGVEVAWDDREFFRVEKPKEDTIQKIKDFLEHFWDKYYEKLSNPSKKKKRWWSF